MPSQALMSVTFRVSCILEVVAFRKATFASSAFLDCFPRLRESALGPAPVVLRLLWL